MQELSLLTCGVQCHALRGEARTPLGADARHSRIYLLVTVAKSIGRPNETRQHYADSEQTRRNSGESGGLTLRLWISSPVLASELV